MPTTYKVLGQVATTSATRTIDGRALNNNIASLTVTADHNMVIGHPVTVASVSASNAVTNKQLSSSVASLTIGTHSFAAGQSVTVTGVDATFNGTYTLSGVTSTVVAYTKNAASVASQSATGSVTGFDPAFNGTYTVLATPTSRMFTYVSSSSVTYASLVNAGTATHSPWNLVYTASPSTSAVTSTLAVTNRSNLFSASYQVALSTSSVSPAAKEYLVYNDVLSANDLVAMTLGVTVDSTIKYIMFAGSHASLSFSVFGAEIT